MTDKRNFYTEIGSITKEMVRSYLDHKRIKISECNDGDIFILTRRLIEEVLTDHGVKLDNCAQIYKWLMGIRDESKKT